MDTIVIILIGRIVYYKKYVMHKILILLIDQIVQYDPIIFLQNCKWSRL